MAIDSTTLSNPAGVNAVTDPNSVRRLATLKDPNVRAEALAGQLESVFFGMMIKAMRATVPEGGLLGKGLGGQNYVEMLDQQLAQMGSMPRDPRFHAALVRQILQKPEEVNAAVGRMNQSEAPPMNPAAQIRK
jgi:Rod binding domain-containing protein